MKNRMIALVALSLSLIAGPLAYSGDSARTLADILAGKGVISAQERDEVDRSGPDGAAHILADLLLKKGLLTQADLDRLDGGDNAGTVVQASMATPVPQTTSLRSQAEA